MVRGRLEIPLKKSTQSESRYPELTLEVSTRKNDARGFKKNEARVASYTTNVQVTYYNVKNVYLMIVLIQSQKNHSSWVQADA